MCCCGPACEGGEQEAGSGTKHTGTGRTGTRLSSLQGSSPALSCPRYIGFGTWKATYYTVNIFTCKNILHFSRGENWDLRLKDFIAGIRSLKNPLHDHFKEHPELKTRIVERLFLLYSLILYMSCLRPLPTAHLQGVWAYRQLTS